MTAPFSGYQQDQTYTAAKDRALLAAQMLKKPGSAAAMDGVITGEPVSLRVDAAGGWVTRVKAGNAMIGGYLVTVPADITLTHDASTTSARRDLVILRVKDLEAGDVATVIAPEIVKGTTTADPVIPIRSIVLGHVTIGASVGSITAANVTDRRLYTAAAGGMVHITAGTNPTVPAGTLLYEVGTDLYWRKKGDGTLARLPFVQPMGYYNGNCATDYRGIGVVYFAGIPTVVGAVATYQGPYGVGVRIDGFSDTGVYLKFFRPEDGTPVPNDTLGVNIIAWGPA